MFFFFFIQHTAELLDVANSSEIKAIIQNDEYYFQKALDKYEEFRALGIEATILDDLVAQTKETPFSYEGLLNKYENNTSEHKILKIIGELVSYIDQKAAMKNTLNEYDDKRTMALAGVRQHVWLHSFLKLKMGEQINELPEVVQNAIRYMEEPDKNVSVFSNKRKEQIYSSLFEGKIGDLFECMREIGIRSENPMNDGYVYSRILHSKEIRKLWDVNDKENKETDIVVSEELGENVEKLANASKVLQEETNDSFKAIWESYRKQDFLSDVFMSENQYDTIIALLKRKKNIILQGVPGVGKTYVAKRIAYSIMGEKDEKRIKFIQFHQSYSYEDFIMGYRPDDNGFTLKFGSFYKFCKDAVSDPAKPYFFIIDEINRGNLSKIFGELLMLIECDKRGEKMGLIYSTEQFSVPENVYIIGMMNTADRSLAIIDYALRRRFCFFELEPAFGTEAFKQYLLNKGIDNGLIEKIIAKLSWINSVIADDSNLGSGFRIGHSYFCDCENIYNDWYGNIIKYEIAPLLEEYWFDDLEVARSHINKLLR